MRRSSAVLLAALIAALVSTSAGAQDSIDVRSSSARSDFPNGIVFTLDAASDAGFDEVRLAYRVAPDGFRRTVVPDCTGGTVVSCTFELTAARENSLIPGADVTYFWRLTGSGVTRETTPKRVEYVDSRFTWQSMSEGNLTLSWYEGSEEEARAVLAAGRESLDETSELLRTAVDFPVKIFYYASAREMQSAIIAEDRQGVVTLGEVVYSDTAMVSADSAPEEIARHEIAHIVVRQAVRGPYDDIPDWLNEGTAVFAQSQPLANQREAVERAIQTGQIISVRSLSSASSGASADKVSLFYGQSWSLVAFLVDSYGEERFAQLFRTFKDGATTGEALEEVYGFNQDGLENAWRDSVGLPPRQAPTPAGDGEQVEPTEPQPTTDEAGELPGPDGGGGAPLGVIVAIASLAVILVGAMAVAGLILARRYR